MKLKIVLIFTLLFLLAVPQAFAADEGSTLSIQLQLNNPAVTINGASVKVEPPFLSGDTTVVPLRVITEAFGAELKWDGKTKSITLTYGDKVIFLTVGSKSAKVNGQEAVLLAAPVLKNNTTMVPIRFISENFGAEVKFDKATRTITITGDKQEGTDLSTGINIDAGKTRMGSSYYGWSMNYPTGLMKDWQSFREDAFAFSDAGGEYHLWVSADPNDDGVAKSTLLQYASLDAKGTIMDKRLVTENGLTYAKLVLKQDASYTEDRYYLKGDYIYNLSITVKAADYQNSEKNKSYQNLLNSFLLSYDAADNSLKDLSSVKDGYRDYVNKEIGINAKIPADWYMDQNGEYLYFYNEKETETMSVRFTSLVKGDTLGQWLQREQDFMNNEFVAAYYKNGGVQDAAVGGVDGKRWTYATKSGDEWNTVYGAYAVKGDYKYEIDVMFHHSADKPELAEHLLQNVVLTGQMSSSLGIIQDDRDFIDRTKMSEVPFKAYNYAISVPDYWKRADDGTDNNVIYTTGTGAGRLTLTSLDQTSLSSVRKNIENSMQEMSQEQDFQFKYLASGTMEIIGGVTAYKYSYSVTVDGVGVIQTYYLLEKDGTVYGINSAVLETHATDANIKMFDAAIKSFRILN